MKGKVERRERNQHSYSGKETVEHEGVLEQDQLSELYPEIHSLVEEVKRKTDSTLLSLLQQHKALHPLLFLSLLTKVSNLTTQPFPLASCWRRNTPDWFTLMTL